MPAVLREHLGMNEVMASVTFIAGAVVVVVLTLPVVRTAQRRFGAVAHVHRRDHDPGHSPSCSSRIPGPRSSAHSSTASSCSRTAPQPPRSTAPARPRSSTTTRGCSTWHCSRSGMIGFIAGVVLAAGLLGPLGFGVVLALIGVGHGRRPPPASAGPSSPDDSARSPHSRRHRLSRATRRRSRATSASAAASIDACDTLSRG